MAQILQQQEQPSQPSTQQNTGASSSNPQQDSLRSESRISSRHEEPIEDPPCGGELPSAYCGPPDMQISSDDLGDVDLEDPGAGDGRSITKAPKAQKRKDIRIKLTLNDKGVFEDDRVNKIIAHRMKYFFNPLYTTWDKVPKSHRQLLWDEIGRACHWEAEIQDKVAKQWDRVNKEKYNSMMHKAHAKYLTKQRPKWMQVRHYHKCVEYWNTPEFQKVSKRNKTNRGVGKVDKDGNLLAPKPTHAGGQKSILKMGDSLVAYVETKRFGKRKQTADLSVSGESNIEHQEEIPNDNPSEVEWIDDQFRVFAEEYQKNLDILYTDKPHLRPSDSDPRDPTAWAMTVGGPNRGRIIGVSGEADPRLLGYSTSKRRSQCLPNFGDDSLVSSHGLTEQLRKMEEERIKMQEERMKMEEERMKMEEERKKLTEERDITREEMERINNEKTEFEKQLWTNIELMMEERMATAQPQPRKPRTRSNA